jgi:hypothetical protein
MVSNLGKVGGKASAESKTAAAQRNGELGCEPKKAKDVQSA